MISKGGKMHRIIFFSLSPFAKKYIGTIKEKENKMIHLTLYSHDA